MATLSWTSDPVIFAILSVSAAGLILVTTAGISIFRPALGLIFFFVFFAFAWRLCSVLYIGLFGPVFSEQLERHIGPGSAVLPIALAQGLVIVALLWSFREARVCALFAEGAPVMSSRVAGGGFELADAAFWLAGFFVVVLWAELLTSGPIPVFTGMERFDYSRLYGGRVHRLLIEWGPMLAFQLGLFLVAPTFRDHPSDWRFGALFASLILYLFLVGHRFSSFYAYSSFFVIPIGVAILARQTLQQRPLFSAAVVRNITIVGAILCVLVVGAVAYSYMVVRGFEGALLFTKLSQRILVQQGEMWWATFERVFLRDNWNGAHAAYKVFVDPFDPGRNSTMQFLMEEALPHARAHLILDLGSAYTGGWPEILFELGGPVGGFLLVAASAVIFSEFMFLLTRCIVQERFATCFFLTPVLYALMITVVSGMLNSFVQLTFLLKLSVALLVYLAEDRWRGTLPLLPAADSNSHAGLQ